jgi:hypothetical protein
MVQSMAAIFLCLFRFLRLLCSGRQAVALENLALRRQLAAFRKADIDGIGPAFLCGMSGSTKNAMDTGSGYLIERSMHRLMGQADSQLANDNSARSSPIPAARDCSLPLR